MKNNMVTEVTKGKINKGLCALAIFALLSANNLLDEKRVYAKPSNTSQIPIESNDVIDKEIEVIRKASEQLDFEFPVEQDFYSLIEDLRECSSLNSKIKMLQEKYQLRKKDIRYKKKQKKPVTTKITEEDYINERVEEIALFDLGQIGNIPNVYEFIDSSGLNYCYYSFNQAENLLYIDKFRMSNARPYFTIESEIHHLPKETLEKIYFYALEAISKENQVITRSR